MSNKKIILIFCIMVLIGLPIVYAAFTYEAIGLTYPDASNWNNNYVGVRINISDLDTPGNTFNITTINKTSACEAENCYIFSMSQAVGGTPLKSGSFVGDICTLSGGFVLNDSTEYRLAVKKTSSYDARAESGIFPRAGTKITWTYGFYEVGSWTEQDTARCVSGIVGEELGSTPPPTPTDYYNYTFNAKDLYDNANINAFGVTITRGAASYYVSTTTGTAYVTNDTIPRANWNLTYNLTYNFSNYFGINVLNINLTNAGNTISYPYQAIAYFNATEVISNNKINSFGVTNGNVTNITSSGLAKLLLKQGTFYITYNSSDYLPRGINITVNPLEIYNASNSLGSANLTVIPYKLDGSTGIENFTVNITSFDYDWYIAENESKYNFTVLVINGTYNISMRPKGFAFANKSIYITPTDRYPNVTFNLYTTNSFNISIYDEILGRPINLFNGRTVYITFAGDFDSYNYTTTTGKTFVDLLTPQEYRINFYSNDYTARDYYYTLLNDTHNIIELYLLSTGNDTDVTYTIQDETGNELSNATVYLKRFYSDSSTYRTVGMGRTNLEGQTILNVDYNDAYYKILAVDGSYSVETVGSKIFTTSLTLTIDKSADVFEKAYSIGDITTDLTFNNNTNTFTYSFNSGSPVQGTLRVSKTNPGGSIVVCENTDISASGNILCVVPALDDKSKYVAEGMINLSGSSPYITDLYNFDNWLNTAKSQFNNNGVLWSILLAGTIAGLGAFNPVLSIIFFLIGLLAVVYFGFSYMTFSVYIIVAIIGGLIIYKIRN